MTTLGTLNSPQSLPISSAFDALAASTDRVRFQLLGQTEEGRNLALAQVGSAENLARLEEIKVGLNALADPRGTDAEEAARLIAEMPIIYAAYGGLHSPETGAPEMLMEMAYRLAVSDEPAIREIRDQVVVFLVPVAEPDQGLQHNGLAATCKRRRLGPGRVGRIPRG